MTATNTHIVNFDRPIEKVYEALTNAGFQGGAANHFSAVDGRVEKFDTTDAGTTVAIRQTVSADKIPAQAQRFVKSGVEVTRTSVISPLNDDGAASTMTTKASDVPASFSASQKLTTQDEGSVLTTNSEFAVNIPLFGGRLEGEAVPYLERILNTEAAVLAGYVTKWVCTTAALPGQYRRDRYRDKERQQQRSRR